MVLRGAFNSISSRSVRVLVAVVGVAFSTLLLAPGGAGAALFSPGQVEVRPAGMQAESQMVTRSALGGGDTHSLGEIMEVAARSGAFDLATLKGVEIAVPGTSKIRQYTGDQVRNKPGQVPTYRFEDDATVVSFPDGTPDGIYGSAGVDLTPSVVIPTFANDFKVEINPSAKKIKSGDSVRFTAEVKGTTGKLTYHWSFGDGSKDVTGDRGSVTHTFKGDNQSFGVTLTVAESGNSRKATASSLIVIGKAEKSKKKKKNEGKKNDDTSGDPGDGYYDDPGYGYGDGYGTGLGDDYGNGSPGTGLPATPKQPKRKDKPEPPVDDGLETVRGELLDPSIPAQVIDPAAEDPSTSTDPGSSEEEKAGGFGLSGGAKTAIGIAFLLGLGGLTELRTFSRFR